MSKQLIINSLEFARVAKALHGKIALRDLVRLHDYLHNLEGVIEYELSGFKTQHDELLLALSLKGGLNLMCQRCLKPLEYSIDIQAQLKLVGTSVELPDVIEEDEAIDSLVVDSQLDVLALMEEEIILALPFAVRHSIEECKNKSYMNFIDAHGNKTNLVFASLK